MIAEQLPVTALIRQQQQVSQAVIKEKEQKIHDLYAEIGHLTTELAWLKKKVSAELSLVERRALVELQTPTLAISRQARLLWCIEDRL